LRHRDRAVLLFLAIVGIQVLPFFNATHVSLAGMHLVAISPTVFVKNLYSPVGITARTIQKLRLFNRQCPIEEIGTSSARTDRTFCSKIFFSETKNGGRIGGVLESKSCCRPNFEGWRSAYVYNPPSYLISLCNVRYTPNLVNENPGALIFNELLFRLGNRLSSLYYSTMSFISRSPSFKAGVLHFSPLEIGIVNGYTKEKEAKRGEGYGKPITPDIDVKWRFPILASGIAFALIFGAIGFGFINSAGLVQDISIPNLLKVFSGVVFLLIAWIVTQAALNIFDLGKVYL
jgi:hypothetical protein